MPTPESESFLPSRTLWHEFAQALRGQPNDYTTGSLSKGIVLLAVPMVLELAMEVSFALVNILWVARLGRDAVAVVGLTESVMALIQTVAIGMSIAAAAVVARRIGEGELERASHAAAQTIILGLGTSVGLGLLLAPFAAQILALMGAAPSAIALGSEYASMMFGWNVTVFLIFLINAVFRGAGDPVLAMKTLCVANGINIVLGPCLIFGWGPFPEMGVNGAALATNIGRGTGVLYQLLQLTGRNSRVRIKWRHLRPAPELIQRIALTAVSATGQQLVVTTSWLALFRILALFGSGAVAGYTVAIRIALFALMPAVGVANAAATLVGQNLGARRPDRAEGAARLAMRISVLLLACIGAVLVTFSGAIVRSFTSDPEALRYGSQALRIISLGFPFYAASYCFSAAFNGAGDAWTPTRLNMYCFWFGQIPLAWLLAHSLALGPIGVFIAVPTSLSISALWSGLLFKRGRWKQHKI